jgi:hypothetical protein
MARSPRRRAPRSDARVVALTRAAPTHETRRRSLLVLGLPRSMTTVVHAYASTALGLTSPAWSYAGEILNPDRSVLAGGAPGGAGGGLAYLTASYRPQRFAGAVALCRRLLAPTGECYKDVVQPFVIAACLRELQRNPAACGAPPPAPLVLTIRRDVAEVASAMLAKGWHYPRAAARHAGSTERQVIEGLLRAQAVLRHVTDLEIDAADLRSEPQRLTAVLTHLYPDVADLPPWRLRPRARTATSPPINRELTALVDDVSSSVARS